MIQSLDRVFGLDEEAVKAARQWRFLPETPFGEPVSVILARPAPNFNELGYAEIGRLLGIERSHVAVLLFRGRQRLRRMLTAPNRTS